MYSGRHQYHMYSSMEALIAKPFNFSSKMDFNIDLLDKNVFSSRIYKKRKKRPKCIPKVIYMYIIKWFNLLKQ